MPNLLDSALVIQPPGTIQWSAALPPVDRVTGTLTAVLPGDAMDITQYARRDREFQHRDAVNAAAVSKVSIFARTVWNGSFVQPVLQGVTEVTDLSGTNVVLPLDPSQVGTSLPNTSTGVTYVRNADIPYAAVQVTDVDLYNRDLMLYETLARAAEIFDEPPINRIDPTGTYVGQTSVWATAQGTNIPKVPNAAEPLNQSTLKDPDLYLAERDNQVASYVSRVTRALTNPFPYATRIYVQVNSTVSGDDARESEVYVLTQNVFVAGNTYTAGDQVLYNGSWYQADVTTTDTPPSTAWTLISAPTLLQFVADPALGSRNRIIYDTQANTLQWFRETLDLVHVPQIVGFNIPGILTGQSVKTVAAVPEKKDAQFYRQKAARIEFATATWQTETLFTPTGNTDSATNNVSGGLNTLIGDTKYVTLPVPATFTVNLPGLQCSAGTYALQCLVRPTPNIEIAGGDNDQGSVDTTDGGTTYSAVGDIRNWEVALPAGGWKLFLEFSNFSATSAAYFGIKASQGATSILANTLPIYYTDSNGNPLSQYTTISSPGIDIQSTGQTYNFAVQWTSGAGQFHIKKLRFEQVNGPDTSHYIMQASWLGAQGTNYDAGTAIPSLSNLDVIGQANQPDVMPFKFYLTGTSNSPAITMTWLPKSASVWQSKSYNAGDQVLYNLVYWQANTITTASQIPGQSSVWVQLGLEPQIPLIFEQIELLRLNPTTPTPDITGFQGFRQDMLERALRADQDAYRQALSQVGTNFPDFRSEDGSWTFSSTGSWASFLEVYAPRLRQTGTVLNGNVLTGRQYQVEAAHSNGVIYNGGTYFDTEKFYGVEGVTDYTTFGNSILVQVGAYRVSRPGDIGKTGLVPAGVEYVQSAGTGTVHGWYPSWASVPTHQTILPWMIEQGFYVADNDFQSPDGNVIPDASNPTVVAPDLVFVPYESSGWSITETVAGFITTSGSVSGIGATSFYDSGDALTFVSRGTHALGGTPVGLAFSGSAYCVPTISSAAAYTSLDGMTWVSRAIPASMTPSCIAYGTNVFVLGGGTGTNLAYSQISPTGLFSSLGETVRLWVGGCETANGNVYALVNSGDVYLQTGGVGSFVGLGQTSRLWRAICEDIHGDVYATVYNGDYIYKQTGGVGNFVATTAFANGWFQIAAGPNGDVYAADVFSHDIYRKPNGSSTFSAMGAPNAPYFGVAVAPNGDVWACASPGDIYLQAGGVGSFVAQGQTTRSWQSMVVTPNGNVYAGVASGPVYLRNRISGNFELIATVPSSCQSLGTGPSGRIWAPNSSNIYLLNTSFNFAQAPAPDYSAINSIVFASSLFVAVGTNRVILTSPDGLNWTERLNVGSGNFRSVGHTGTWFVAVGDSATVYTSPDGITWTSRAFPTSNTLVAAGGGDGFGIISTSTGDVYMSADSGASWSFVRTCSTSPSAVQQGVNYLPSTNTINVGFTA